MFFYGQGFKKLETKTENKTRSNIVLAFKLENHSGFSLIECLLSLSLSLMILVSALEIFSQARKIFYKLKDEQESTLAAVTAIEKIQEDLETAGAGLSVAAKDANFSPLSAGDSSVLIFSRKKKIQIATDAESGQNYIFIVPDSETASLLKKGQTIFLTDGQQGELVYLTGILNNKLSFSPSLINSYRTTNSEVLLLEKIEIYLDKKQKILRRKVNNTSGQPLLEEVSSFEPFYDQEKNLFQIKLSSGKVREKNYELVFYPKNIIKNSTP